MKKILLIAVLMLLYSCSLYKQKKQTNNNDYNLSEIKKHCKRFFKCGIKKGTVQKLSRF
jgi:hypothetical protein